MEIGNRSGVRDRVRGVLAGVAVIDASQLSDDEGIFADGPDGNMGLDSLDGLNLVIALTEEFGLSLDEREFKRVRTVGDLIELVASKAAGVGASE